MILEQIMCKHLLDNNVLSKKQFDFQENHSAEHAVVQLTSLLFNICSIVSLIVLKVNIS